MAVILALEKLFDDVQARFAVETPALASASFFGWREPPRQGTPTSRIVWVPGDPRGALGAVGPARFPGGSAQRPRPLATLHELFYVEISGADATAPDNERAQYHATRLLFDAWLRAVYLAAYGTFAIVSAEWIGVADRAQRRYGAAIRVVGTIDAKVPDSALTAADAKLGAELDLAELSVTDHISIPRPP